MNIKTISLLTWAVLLIAPQQLTAQVDANSARDNPSQPAKPSPSVLKERQSEIDNAGKDESESYRKERDAKDDAFKAEQLRQNWIITKATVWITFATCLNFIVGIVYAVFAGRQLKAMERNERPVVVVFSAEILPKLAPNVPLRTRVSYVNSGRTPACEMDITTQFAKPGFTYWKFPALTVHRGLHNIFLAAGHSGAIESAPAEALTLDDDMFDKIVGGKHFLLIYGEGSYKNMAGKTMQPTLKFCFRYSREHEQFIPYDL